MYGKSVYAHRLSFIVHGGVIPDGMHMDHICRITLCINPEHLRVVTPIQNILENSMSPCALNKVKTHCVNGHEYSPENAYINKSMQRSCKICRHETDVRRNALSRYARAARKREGANVYL